MDLKKIQFQIRPFNMIGRNSCNPGLCAKLVNDSQYSLWLTWRGNCRHVTHNGYSTSRLYDLQRQQADAHARNYPPTQFHYPSIVSTAPKAEEHPWWGLSSHQPRSLPRLVDDSGQIMTIPLPPHTGVPPITRIQSVSQSPLHRLPLSTTIPHRPRNNNKNSNNRTQTGIPCTTHAMLRILWQHTPPGNSFSVAVPVSQLNLQPARSGTEERMRHKMRWIKFCTERHGATGSLYSEGWIGGSTKRCGWWRIAMAKRNIRFIVRSFVPPLHDATPHESARASQ